mgnify:CR=1 FL=1
MLPVVEKFKNSQIAKPPQNRIAVEIKNRWNPIIDIGHRLASDRWRTSTEDISYDTLCPRETLWWLTVTSLIVSLKVIM